MMVTDMVIDTEIAETMMDDPIAGMTVLQPATGMNRTDDLPLRAKMRIVHPPETALYLTINAITACRKVIPMVGRLLRLPITVRYARRRPVPL
jgi:hypothetical protein